MHRCRRHKERNVCDQLPQRDRDQVRARMRAAWSAYVVNSLVPERIDALWPAVSRYLDA